MPAKSQAQQRWAFANKKAKGSKGKAARDMAAEPVSGLPEFAAEPAKLFRRKGKRKHRRSGVAAP